MVIRELTGHRVNPANDKLLVEALDGPGPGGASHAYQIAGFDSNNNPSRDAFEGMPVRLYILFQNGAINEVGVNGITHEALLAVLIDRLEGFQSGPYANKYNERALMALITGQNALQERTFDRMRQGVEGTMAVGNESKPETETAKLAGPADDPAHKGKPASGNPIMRYFSWGHLPNGPLKETSQLVGNMAQALDERLPAGAEKSAGMRKLLEAKDCFVRAALP